MLVGITKVRNEALILEDTLCHMLTHVDKIFLYDDASTDKTFEIANSFDDVEVTRGFTHSPDRDYEETRHRGLMLAEALAEGAEWCLCFDADERIEGNVGLVRKSGASGYRFKLFDGYMTERCIEEYKRGDLTQLPRMWGPERRDILMLFRTRDAFFSGFDQREPFVKGPVETADIYVRHYGKCLSVQHWEETCEYYSKWQKYAAKWNARRGKAIHTKSDFDKPLFKWDDVVRMHG